MLQLFAIKRQRVRKTVEFLLDAGDVGHQRTERQAVEW
jgi:hypothetical protein